jgi:hypothetical protein
MRGLGGGTPAAGNATRQPLAKKFEQDINAAMERRGRLRERIHTSSDTGAMAKEIFLYVITFPLTSIIDTNFKP